MVRLTAFAWCRVEAIQVENWSEMVLMLYLFTQYFFNFFYSRFSISFLPLRPPIHLLFLLVCRNRIRFDSIQFALARRARSSSSVYLWISQNVCVWYECSWLLSSAQTFPAHNRISGQVRHEHVPFRTWSEWSRTQSGNSLMLPVASSMQQVNNDTPTLYWTSKSTLKHEISLSTAFTQPIKVSQKKNYSWAA